MFGYKGVYGRWYRLGVGVKGEDLLRAAPPLTTTNSRVYIFSKSKLSKRRRPPLKEDERS